MSDEYINLLKSLVISKLDNINYIQKLKKSYPNYPINELLTLFRIRKNAQKRIKNAENFLFTTKGVEQSSSTSIAEYNASKFINKSIVADFCCGNGIDCLNIAQNVKKVYAIDLSEDALLCCRFNAQQMKINNIEFLNQNVLDFDEQVEGIFIDPDRRPKNQRVIIGSEMSPSINEIKNIINKYKHVVIKLSPAYPYLEEKINISHTWEFVSENRTLKEVLLCTGDFATKNYSRKSVILPNKQLLFNNNKISVTNISDYIYNPDPAIIRAGLVQDLGYLLDYTLINKHISILTGMKAKENNFGKCYSVISSFHYSKKIFQKFINNNNIGELIVIMKGFPETPDKFKKKFKIKGKEKHIVMLIRLDDEFLAVHIKPI